jgi:capsular exopolysaccharide synthesis family protein
MDTTDRPNANLPAQLSGSSLRLPVQTPSIHREIDVVPAASTVDSRQLLRGLGRNWWRIALLWVVISSPLVYLIYKLVEPSYQAYSLLLIESNQQDLFAPSIWSRDSGGQQPTYLQTQITTIISNPVLDAALSVPSVASLPMIKDSTDPKNDLRKKLDVQIIPNTHWIRVALESADPNEAAQIVNAVADAFGDQTKEYGTGASRLLKADLEKYKNSLKEDIDKTRGKLRELFAAGNVMLPKVGPSTKGSDVEQLPQPAFDSLTLDQYRTTKDLLMQTEFQLMELEAKFQAKLAEAQQLQAAGESLPLPSKEDSERLLRDQIVAEFKHDPAVLSLIEQMKAVKEDLDHTKGIARKGQDPARVRAQKRWDKLDQEYNDLWNTKSAEIRQRLLVTTVAPGAPEVESLTELKRKIDEQKLKKERLEKLISKFDANKQLSHTDTVDATFLRDDLNRCSNMFDQVNRKLESLTFTIDKPEINIARTDRAEVPKAPYNNKRLKYMAVLPVGVLLAVLGLFLLLEAKAQRVADPDLLSSRVQSEVYALPPLPTSRTPRKLNGSGVDDQIDRFIQRLDHLRFAVCGDRQDTGLGRCVLVTSAIGGEGKTTLAAQLAARCGNAGISTLLIDADLRRASLCPLLDVPEGPGLSNILKGEVKIDDIVIPVQGGTFHLLAAGTPVQDTSRILQGRNFAMLIAQLRERYEMIIIDSPPVLPIPDALMLGRWTDGALLAARFEISRAPQVERARRQLDMAGIPVLGTVINGMRSSDAYYGRYTYGRHRASQGDSSGTS